MSPLDDERYGRKCHDITSSTTFSTEKIFAAMLLLWNKKDSRTSFMIIVRDCVSVKRTLIFFNTNFNYRDIELIKRECLYQLILSACLRISFTSKEKIKTNNVYKYLNHLRKRKIPIIVSSLKWQSTVWFIDHRQNVLLFYTGHVKNLEIQRYNTRRCKIVNTLCTWLF